MKKTPLRRTRMRETRTRVNPISDRRRLEFPERAQCRAVVLARDRVCRGKGLTPVVCTGTPTEVHELGRGAYRASCYLDPALCIGLCHTCHAWVTLHPTLANDLGLALRGWEVEQILKTRASGL